MENLQASEKKPTINLNKAPRSFENGVVGLGIVAAMTDLSKSKTREPIFSTNSPRSRPIPIVDLRGAERENSEVDESSESYTCVISHIGNKLVKKCVYFDENKLENCSVFFASSSPMNIGDEVKEDIWSEDFLSSCTLCNKQLQGLDIFMYRGEKAFCSTECRDKQIRSDNHHKKKCRSEARKRLDYSASPSSGSPLICAGVAVA